MPRPFHDDDAAEEDQYLPDSTVHAPFNDTQDQDLPSDDNDGTSMAISHPNVNDRGDVRVESSARSTKYSKVKSGSTKAKNARQPSKGRKNAIGKGKRVYVERGHLTSRIPVGSEAYKLLEVNGSNKFRFFGTVGGKPPNSKLFKVKLDLLPPGEQEVLLARGSIHVLDAGEEETPYTARDKETEDTINEYAIVGNNDELDEEVAGSPSKKKKRSDIIRDSYNSFTDQPVDVRAVAEIFIFKYGQKDEEKIIWTILNDSQQVTECPIETGKAMESPKEETSTIDPFMKVDITWKAKPEEVDYNSILFEHFFPSVKGEHFIKQLN